MKMIIFVAASVFALASPLSATDWSSMAVSKPEISAAGPSSASLTSPSSLMTCWAAARPMASVTQPLAPSRRRAASSRFFKPSQVKHIA